MSQAYSQITIKSIDADQRIIRGIATTATPDRVSDVVEPAGAEFALPIPFLWQHMHSQPIGQVTAATVTAAGIEVVIQLTKPEEVESESLKQRLTEAWDSIKTGLVRGLSIGFRGVEVAYNEITGGLHFLKWQWYELSAVTIPANADASITEIKSIATKHAALGNMPSSKDTTTPVGATTTHRTVKLFEPGTAGVTLS